MDDYTFPDPLDIPADPDDEYGLFAIGGDLAPERLINAYRLGIFPWTARWNRIHHWYCPRVRFVLLPDQVHVSHSMRTLLNHGDYEVTSDRCFDRVIGMCSSLRIHHPGAWLGDRMVDAYTRLHRMGYAHSVETWHNGRLVGGLYGVQLGGVFFGESMFSVESNGSKVALIGLCRHMAAEGGRLVDCQFHTAHLQSMGGRTMPYAQFRTYIDG